MKTKVAAIYGKRDVRLRVFELPEITDNELLVSVISDSVCLSTWKAALLGSEHKRVPDDLENHPVITGHECAGVIVEVGKNLTGKYKKGQRFVLQPAMGLPSGYSAGYSYEYFGGNATYMIIPEIAINLGCVLPYHGSYFAAASLAEPMCCIIGAYHANYHTTQYVYEHRMGVKPGGNIALLACAGPMGIGAIDYAINGGIQPSRVVVVDIDDKRLAQVQVAIQNVTQEQTQRNAALNEMRQRYKEKTQQLADVKTICEQEARIKTLEAQRAQLQAGQPCPLCGSTSHPAVEAYQALEPGVNQSRLLALENEVKKLGEEGATLRGQLDAITKQLQRDENEAQSLRQDEQALTQQWQAVTASLNITLQPLDDIQPWLDAQDEHERQLRLLSQRHELQGQIAAHNQQIIQYQQQIEQRQQLLLTTLTGYALTLPQEDEEESWLATRQQEAQSWQQRQNELTALQNRIQQLTPILETLPQSDELPHCEETVVLENWRQVHEQCLALHSQQQTLQQQDVLAAQSLQKAQAQFDTALQASVFDDQQAFLAALMDEQTLTQLEQLKQNLENQRRQAQTLVTQTAETLAQHQQHRPDDGLALTVTVEQIQQELAQTHQKLRENTTSQGEIRQQLKQDADNRQQQQTLMQQIAQMTQQVEDWRYLNSLIGSKEGDKFRKFAQGLTLDNLVHLANQQLTRLHGRYLLQRKASEALEVEVVDTWQADAVRDTRTLSGGESFLVSLALALALSDLVSHKTRIDSLFLDEGFGTLDSETLDTALDALDALNASGKTIGVISHVEAMKERIPVQIKVKKINGLGYSKLESTFAVK